MCSLKLGTGAEKTPPLDEFFGSPRGLWRNDYCEHQGLVLEDFYPEAIFAGVDCESHLTALLIRQPLDVRSVGALLGLPRYPGIGSWEYR